MSKSMQNLNGDIFCAVDVETTGDMVGHHEMVQICLLPLDSNMEPIKEVLPFYVDIRPERPDCADRDAMRVNKLDMYKLTTQGLDKYAAASMLREWMYNKLQMPYNKGGYRRCKIVPVGHNYAGFDYGFVKAWLDECGESYNELFSFHMRDTMIQAAFVNDRLAMRGRVVKFPKLGLKDLARVLGVEYDLTRHHDALYDCSLTAQVFKKLNFVDIVGMF